MATIAYTCKYFSAFDRKEVEKRKFKDAADRVQKAWEKRNAAEERMEKSRVQMEAALRDFNLAMMSLSCEQKKYDDACNAFHDIVPGIIAHLRSMMPEPDGDDASEEPVEDPEDPVDEESLDPVWVMEVSTQPHRHSGRHARTRFTKRDILTPAEACKAGKASKRHKLVVKERSDDATRKAEAKLATKAKAASKRCRAPNSEEDEE